MNVNVNVNVNVEKNGVEDTVYGSDDPVAVKPLPVYQLRLSRLRREQLCEVGI